MFFVKSVSVGGAVRARTSLLALACLLLVALGLVGLNITTGFGVPCPLHSLTGWSCPFCGATRMAVALLRGDFAEAWRRNGFVLIAGVGVGLRAIGWLIELIRGRDRRWIPERFGRFLVPGGFAVAIAWMILRNLL